MSLVTHIFAQIRATLTGAPDIGSLTYEADGAIEHAAMQSGTTTGRADLIWPDSRTIAASGNEDIDLAGSLVDPLGNACVFAKVKAILIKADAGNTNDVVFGPASSNGFLGPFADASDRLSIPPGGVVLLAAPSAGWAVTAGTADLLNVTNSAGGTGVTYEITIVGTSA